MTDGASFSWESAARSEVGNVRELNEDTCLDLSARGLWVVADGMGGHEAGEVASQMVVDSLRRVGSHDQLSRFVDEVEDLVLDANQRLYSMSLTGEEPRIIGCTLSAMLASDRYCLNMWAGDSRAYRLREGKLAQITRDHSEAEEMIERGEINEAEAETHPLANVITRAVGGAETLYVDLVVERIEDGDRYLICSDGLYKELSHDEIEAQLAEGSCVDACGTLVDTALSRECADNVTVIVVDFNETAG